MRCYGVIACRERQSASSNQPLRRLAFPGKGGAASDAFALEGRHRLAWGVSPRIIAMT